MRIPGIETLFTDIPKPPAKNPRTYIFPIQPEDCSRGDCKLFYSANTRTLSFALYASPTIDCRRVCVYSFCCGYELESVPWKLKEGEQPSDLLKRVIPELLSTYVEIAKNELEIVKPPIS